MAASSGPDASTPPPPVWRWYRLYAGALAAVYVLVVVGGLLMAVLAPQEPGEPPPWLFGLLAVVLGGVFAAAFIAAFFLPRRPWAWIYHLVLIAIGMTSACCIPFSVPLLVFWLKTETRAYFGRA